MGISIYEFSVAMETLGAEYVGDVLGSRSRAPVPSYMVKNDIFSHSGSYYIVQGKYPRTVGKALMDKAMAELGEEYPGKDNYWYNEIHSIKGILTLALMIENRYTKELAQQLISDIYKKLLSTSSFLDKPELISKQVKLSGFDELYKALNDFDNLVNPLPSLNLKFKEPKQYLDMVRLNIWHSESGACSIVFTSDKCSVEFIKRVNEQGYSETWCYKINLKDELQTTIGHYFVKGHPRKADEEELFLQTYPKDRSKALDLRISLKTGLAWKTYEEPKAKRASELQIQCMSEHLYKCMEIAKKTIVDNMVN